MSESAPLLEVGFKISDDLTVSGPELGSGFFGAVVPCRTPGGDTFAVKVLRPEHHEFAARVLKEAEIQRNLWNEGAVGVLPVYDMGRLRLSHETVSWFAMEMLSGARHLWSSDWSYSDRVELVTRALRHVEGIHRRGIRHRDLKPGNILVDDRRRVFLTDFGLSSRDPGAGPSPTWRTTLHQKTTVLGAGTPAFCPPEQAGVMASTMPELVDRPQVDVFACGVMVYVLLSGDWPFDDEASSKAAILKLQGRELPAPSTFAPPDGTLHGRHSDRALSALRAALADAVDLDWDARAESLSPLIEALGLYRQALSPVAQHSPLLDLELVSSVWSEADEYTDDPGRATNNDHPSTTGTASLWDWQRKAVRLWEQAGCRAIVEACTGAGKTFTALEAARRHLAADSRHNVLVLVPTKPLIRQWLGEVRQHLTTAVGEFSGARKEGFENHQVIVTTPHSLANLADRSPQLSERTLLIADECHHYGGQTLRWRADGEEVVVPGVWAQTVLDLPCRSRLGLSATVERLDGGHDTVLPESLGPVVMRYSLGEALRDGVIAPFRVAFIRCKFDDPETREEYEVLSKRLGRLRSKLINEHGIPSNFGVFMQQVNLLAGQGVREARSYLSGFSRRLQLLADVAGKYEALRELVPVMRACKRSLVFSQRVPAARRANEVLTRAGLRVGYIDGGINERTTVFRRFAAPTRMAGRLHAIISPQVLDEGVDVPKAEMGVVLMASSSWRQMLQRIGRVVRKQDDKIAKFAVLVVAGTSEDPSEGGGHEDFILDVLNAVGDDGWRVFDVVEMEACRQWLLTGVGWRQKNAGATAPEDTPAPRSKGVDEAKATDPEAIATEAVMMADLEERFRESHSELDLCQGFILVRESPNLAALQAKIEEYATIAGGETKLPLTVKLVEHEEGIAVVFPFGIPAYDFNNLVGWIDDGNDATTGFLTDPAGRRYALYPEPGQDTLLGTGPEGEPVEVYLPDNTLRPAKRARRIERPRLAPDLSRVVAEFPLELGFEDGFGNPKFEMTDETDLEAGLANLFGGQVPRAWRPAIDAILRVEDALEQGYLGVLDCDRGRGVVAYANEEEGHFVPLIHIWGSRAPKLWLYYSSPHPDLWGRMAADPSEFTSNWNDLVEEALAVLSGEAHTGAEDDESLDVLVEHLSVLSATRLRKWAQKLEVEPTHGASKADIIWEVLAVEGTEAVTSLRVDDLKAVLRKRFPMALLSGGVGDLASRLLELWEVQCQGIGHLSASDLRKAIGDASDRTHLREVVEYETDRRPPSSSTKDQLLDQVMLLPLNEVLRYWNADELRAIAGSMGLPTELRADAIVDLLEKVAEQ